jgi:multidrug efflux pump subunit AcrA (membrane-fusion protein)/predicted acylesterase/phospholipase RssA
MKAYRILAIDGGGIRGLMSAIWLHHLQVKLDRPLHTCVDLIAGTSIGSLIACAVSMGIDTETIVNYFIDCENWFGSFTPKNWLNFFNWVRDPYRYPKFDGSAMELFLQKLFGEKKFGELYIKPTLICTYDILNRQVVVLDNTDPLFAQLPVWKVCRASMALPTFFSAYQTELAGKKVALIDGGVAGGNPTVCAIARAANLQTDAIAKDSFIVASIGSGEFRQKISPLENKQWQIPKWAVPIVRAMSEAPADLTGYAVERLISPECYFRFQVSLEEAYQTIDNSKPEHIQLLIQKAETYIANSEENDKLERLASLLLDDTKPVIKPYNTLISFDRPKLITNMDRVNKFKKNFSLGVLGIGCSIAIAGISGSQKTKLLDLFPATAKERVSISSHVLPVEVLRLKSENSYSISHTYTGAVASRRNSKLGFDQTGQLVTVRVKEGDRVKAGTILASIDTQILKIQSQELLARRDRAVAQLQELQAGARSQTIDAAKAAVRKLQQQLELFQQKLVRRQALFDRGAISREQLEDVTSQTNTLQAQLDEAESKLQELLAGTRRERLNAQTALINQVEARQANLTAEQRKSTLTAPFSGTIVARLVDEGTIVAAGQPILQLIEDRYLEARVGVPKSVAVRLQLGSFHPVRLEEKTYRAKISATIPQINPSTNTVTVVLQLPEMAATETIVGQIVRLQLEETVPSQGYWLPTTALVSAERGLWSCYVLGHAIDRKSFPVERRLVEILHTDGDRVFVRGTIQSNDRAIANGTHRLVVGQLVQISKD